MGFSGFLASAGSRTFDSHCFSAGEGWRGWAGDSVGLGTGQDSPPGGEWGSGWGRGGGGLIRAII